MFSSTELSPVLDREIPERGQKSFATSFEPEKTGLDEPVGEANLVEAFRIRFCGTDDEVEAARASLDEELARLLEHCIQHHGHILRDEDTEAFYAVQDWVHKEATIEGLVSWLTIGTNWQSLSNHTWTLQGPLSGSKRVDPVVRENARTPSMVWPGEDSNCLQLFYCMDPRERGTPAFGQAATDYLLHDPRGKEIHAFASEFERPRRFETLIGVEALKAGLKHRDWIGLSRSLSRDPFFLTSWLFPLAEGWFLHTFYRIAEKERAVELEKIPSVQIGNDKYARLPKVMAGLLWAFGQPGVPRPIATKTNDGNYTPITLHTRVPVAYDLLSHADLTKAPKAVFPIIMGSPARAPDLTASATSKPVLPPVAAKLVVLLMAAAYPRQSTKSRTTLRELVRMINPNTSHPKKSHFESVLRGLVQLEGLRVVFSEPRARRVMDIQVPFARLTPENYDQTILFSLTSEFIEALKRVDRLAGRSFKGDFIFNLTGAMKLPTTRPGLLRQYIRATAQWNSIWRLGTNGEPDLERQPRVSTREWLKMTNYLSPSAAEYIRSNHQAGNRRKLSECVQAARSDAEYLASEAGGKLIQVDRADGDWFRLLWKPEYIEAWKEMRKGHHRMST